MANLADRRRLNEASGKPIHEGEISIDKKEELMYIPFIESGNPDEIKPWLYKGYYKMPDGHINMELKRVEGHMELSIDSVENYKDYIGTAVEQFVKRIYEESPHKAETILLEEHETEIDLLKKELVRLELEASNAKSVVLKYKELLDEL